MVDQVNTNERKPERVEEMIGRHRRELDEAVKAETIASRVAGQAAQETVRADAAEVLAATLEEVQRRVAGGSVPVIARYGALPPELGMQLREAQAAIRDEAAAVVIVPRPDRHGHTERKAFAVVDVSNIYRDRG